MVEIVKMLFLNSLGLIIGSGALISTNTKMTNITAAKMNEPMTCQEPHAYCVPAQEKASSKGTVHAIRVTTPR